MEVAKKLDTLTKQLNLQVQLGPSKSVKLARRIRDQVYWSLQLGTWTVDERYDDSKLCSICHRVQKLHFIRANTLHIEF